MVQLFLTLRSNVNIGDSVDDQLFVSRRDSTPTYGDAPIVKSNTSSISSRPSAKKSRVRSSSKSRSKKPLVSKATSTRNDGTIVTPSPQAEDLFPVSTPVTLGPVPASSDVDFTDL